MLASSLLAVALLAAAPALAVKKPLDIQVTKEASCSRKTQVGDSISVHYRGTLESGDQFDASYDRGQPLVFTVGAGQVIKGWDEGLLDMCPGEKRKLTVQPEYGYGDNGIGGTIPGKAVLIFETELVSIQGVDEPGKGEL